MGRQSRDFFRPRCLTPLLFSLLALAGESLMPSASKGHGKPHPYITLAFPASASLTPSVHAKVELIAEKDSLEPGRGSWLGLRFELESGWHIYWINPGDSGEPPRVQWHLPAGFQVGPIEWPTPQRIEDHSLVDYGYLGEALLMVPIHRTADIPGEDSVKFGAAVKWLVCRETCIPEQADLTLSLPMRRPEGLSQPVQRKGARLQSHWHELFIRMRARLPRPAPRDWKIAAMSEKDQFVLSIETGLAQPHATFFPLEPNQIENAAPQEASPIPRGVRLKLRKSDQLLKPISHLKGVVEFVPGRAFVVDAPVSASDFK